MPTRRLAPRRTPTTALHPALIERLWSGFWWPGRGPEPSDAALRRLWPAARVAVWERTIVYTVPWAAREFDGFRTDAIHDGCWCALGRLFEAGQAAAFEAEVRGALQHAWAELQRFEARDPRAARALAPSLGIYRAGLRTLDDALPALIAEAGDGSGRVYRVFDALHLHGDRTYAEGLAARAAGDTGVPEAPVAGPASR